MREIKFRAWIGDKYEYNIVCGSLGNFYVVGMDENDISCIGANTIYDENVVIEQFTGLHDCDGKEIYEGDIVEIIMPCGTPNEITDTVQYNDVYGCFFLRTRYTSVCDLIQSDYNFKIIGNIHEVK